jgi:hypothetical protein
MRSSSIGSAHGFSLVGGLCAGWRGAAPEAAAPLDTSIYTDAPAQPQPQPHSIPCHTMLPGGFFKISICITYLVWLGHNGPYHSMRTWFFPGAHAMRLPRLRAAASSAAAASPTWYGWAIMGRTIACAPGFFQVRMLCASPVYVRPHDNTFLLRYLVHKIASACQRRHFMGLYTKAVRA